MNDRPEILFNPDALEACNDEAHLLKVLRSLEGNGPVCAYQNGQWRRDKAEKVRVKLVTLKLTRE